MQDVIEKFDRIFINEVSWESSLARRVRSLFPPQRIERVRDLPLPESAGPLSADEFNRSKRLLYITEFKGQFFKRCPGSRPGLACCNYFVLNWGLQCDMNCSYCYLQSFINTRALTIYSNLHAALTELSEMAQLKNQILRVGTGETVDSLSLDEVTLFSHDLIAFFRDFPNWTLEFKTKSAKVDQFLNVPHAGNVIVSWSINPQNIVDAEEHGTASLAERLSAARRCADKGFQISFHIDPMIWHPQWEDSYTSLVDKIATQFTPSEIPYLSVGALRFQPEQKAIMRERFGMNSYVTNSETFPSSDGKLRYDAKLRHKMYQSVLERFKHHDQQWRVFMCMESPETWLKTHGQSPFKNPQLSDLFRPIRPEGGEVRRTF